MDRDGKRLEDVPMSVERRLGVLKEAAALIPPLVAQRQRNKVIVHGQLVLAQMRELTPRSSRSASVRLLRRDEVDFDLRRMTIPNIPGPDGPDREEYLRRVRKAGPPDEWVRLDEPTRDRMWNEAQERNRVFDKRFNIVMALIVGALVVIPALWACSQGAPEGEPPAYEVEEYEMR